VHAIMHFDLQRNIGSDDSIEDLAFEEKESWQISNIVARKTLQLSRPRHPSEAHLPP